MNSKEELDMMIADHSEPHPCAGMCREGRIANELRDARKVIAAAEGYIEGCGHSGPCLCDSYTKSRAKAAIGEYRTRYGGNP